MQYTYYYTPGSISLVAHIALEMSGVSYQSVAIDFSKQEQKSAEFLKVNPLGRVPALRITDEHNKETVITEAIAIINYVATLGFNEASLLFSPSSINPLLQARIDSFNSFLCSTVHVTHAHMWRGERWVDSDEAKIEMARKAPQNLAEQFSLIEDHWFIGSWVHGDTFTLSDLYLFVIARWLIKDNVNPALFPKVQQHSVDMNLIPEVSKLLKSLYQ